MVAGYGRYRRAPCEVGRHGPEKFEYCGTGDECVMGSQEHRKSNCTISWKYKGQTIKGCSHEPTPSSTDENCQKFLKKTGFKFEPDVDEVALVDSSGKGLAATCYRQDPGSYGWCGTIHDYNNLKEQKLEVHPGKGWGFCQRSCYTELDKIPLGGIERFKTVDVLNDEYCEQTITSHLKHRPKVICIAFNFTHRTSFYNAKTYEKMEIDPASQIKLMKRKVGWYVTGTGLCLGDSGGPLFKTYSTSDGSMVTVLIGTVSRGTGTRGNCGGLDNATHYVRIKMFVKWIINYIQEKDLCFSTEGKEIRPNKLFKAHVGEDVEAQRKADEDIKNQDPKD